MKDRNFDDAALGALLDGTIDDVTGVFSQLTRADLEALRKAEEAGKTRSGLMTAIDAQLETLKQEEQQVDPPATPPEQGGGEQTGGAQGAGEQGNAVTAAAAESDSDLSKIVAVATDPGNAFADDYMLGMANGLILADHTVNRREGDVPYLTMPETGPTGGKRYTQAEVGEIVKGLNESHASETARLNDRVAAAEAAAAGRAGKAAPKQKAGKPIAVQAGADPFEATRKGVVQVVFGDEDGVSFGDAVPPLDFTAGDFEKRGDTAVLKQKVDFGPTGPRAAIASAFLVAGGKAVGRHDFVSPITTGAGAEVTIPENGMAFSAVTEPAPATEPLQG